MKKLLQRSKKFWIWTGIGLIVFIVILSKVFGNGAQPTYETMVVTRGDLVQEVSVTGKVKAAQSVDMQFEQSGRVAAIYHKSGDVVAAGAVLASLDSQDLQANVLEKEASLLSAQADLDRTIKNYESLSNTGTPTSLRTELENAQKNVVQVQAKADADLASEYTTALNVFTEVATGIDGASIVLRNTYMTYLQGRYAFDYLETLRQQAVDQVVVARALPRATHAQIDASLTALVKASQIIVSALTSLQQEMQANASLISSSTDRSTINTEASGASADLSSISSIIQDIASQRVTNGKNIADAQATLANAQAAFPTPEDIAQKQAGVKQAQAALLSARAQLRKSMIIAPFAGIVSKVEVERGETVSSSVVAASMISASGYQLEANITEVDIAKIAMGNEATLTLDAYGSDQIFKARISSVDPGETIIEGVTTYKTVLDFEGVEGNIIRPNMTANIDIQTNKKEGVLSVPQRAIITRNGEKFVRIEANTMLEERIVTTGLVGKNGYVEILTGLTEGEKVVTFIND